MSTSPDRRNEILRLLRAAPDKRLSGAVLSRQLGVSRAAVWKQVEQLRSEGYEISALAGRGYALQNRPDRLNAAELEDLGTAVIGCRIEALGETDSTNLRAALFAEAGAPEGTVVLAEAQSAGKGRLGRIWSSPAGVNLYLSVILRPPVPPRQAPLLTFLSSCAVARAIAAETGLRPEVKWPNDVLLAGAKVAGLLNEMNAETERVNYVILGIGVNLNMGQHQFPKDLRYPATSLSLALGHPVDRVAFCRRLLQELDLLYRGYPANEAEILSGWQSYFSLLQQPVEADLSGRIVSGLAVGIDADGALKILTPDGTVERILAGDVRPASAGKTTG